MFSSVLLLFDIGMQELVLIMLVALLLFGGDKLPELARGLGKGIRDFKDASESVKREINNQIDNLENQKTTEKTNAIAETSAVQTDDQDPYNYTDGNFDDVHKHTQVANTIPASQGYVAATDQLDTITDEAVDYHAIKSGENHEQGSTVSTEADKQNEPYKS